MDIEDFVWTTVVTIGIWAPYFDFHESGAGSGTRTHSGEFRKLLHYPFVLRQRLEIPLCLTHVVENFNPFENMICYILLVSSLKPYLSCLNIILW